MYCKNQLNLLYILDLLVDFFNQINFHPHVVQMFDFLSLIVVCKLSHYALLLNLSFYMKDLLFLLLRSLLFSGIFLDLCRIYYFLLLGLFD